MQHRADHRNGIVQLQMAVRVPAEARHAVARPDAEFDQRVRELRHALAEVGVRVTERRTVVEARDDRARAVVAQDVFENPRDREIDVHHRPGNRRAR